ncbi:short-chain dehydrogenase [Paenibacillus glucanolyticus]|jgi:NAD(P)-dependent dehydrogenase (short-subunit alcohol dehydrogenase family)|uniref:oxidoreductase n=1 Tax=Paenibacillus TaxID=44249 RepID=UPI000D1A1B63|nr:oxidoreductase [Paenibacillus glucanolyticus]AVV56287.1 short-chain dehydrogenase [Paenibacillus glucanolyticus]
MANRKWTYDHIPNQSGRVVLITGANSGLGYQEALMMAKKGAEVIIAGRDRIKVNTAIKTIAKQAPNAKLSNVILDLADLNSVSECVKEVQRRYGRLDLLINNAGVMIPPFSHTKQGFELQFGTNHLGHFALTGQLLPLILQTPNSRIASMTSLAGMAGSIDFSDLNYENRRYIKMLAYGQSKLANLMFINELAIRLKNAGSKTIAVAAHPGGSPTNLQQSGGFFFRRILTPLTSQPASEGALPILRAACDPKAANGSFWAPSGLFGLTGSPVEVKMPSKAVNKTQCNQLWDISEKLTGVSYAKFFPTDR